MAKTSLSDSQNTYNARTEALFRQHQLSIYKQTDRVFAILMPIQWLAGILAACFLSPLTWDGAESRIHIHIWTAILLGGTITILPVALVFMRPGTVITRNIVAISQMLMTGLLIHLSGGRIETHFHVFGSLAFLAFYRDWRVLVPATAVTFLDHLVRGWFYPMSMYGVLNGGEWRWIEHAGWVIFIDIFLFTSCYYGAKEMWKIAKRTAELDASEERHRAVVEQSKEGMVFLDPETFQVMDCNEAFRKLLGYATSDDVKKLSNYDYSATIPEELERLSQVVIEQRSSVSVEDIYYSSDAARIPVEVSINLIHYGNSQAYCCVVRDITERKSMGEKLQLAHDQLEQRVAERTEELICANDTMRVEVNERKRAESELSAAQQFLYKVIDNVPCHIFVKDREGRFVLANNAVAEIYGTTIERLLGKTDADFNPNADEVKQIRQDDLQVLNSLQEKFIPEEAVTSAAGETRWFQTIKRPLVLHDGSVQYLLGMATDMTERKLLENQLHHAQKMESIGQLAAGIAHEINTPTQYVGDNTRFVQDAFKDLATVLETFTGMLAAARSGLTPPELIAQVEKEIEAADLEYLLAEIPHALQQSLEGVTRIAKIVQAMKDFAHPGANEKKAADLNKAIESTITVARNEWKYIAEVETHFAENLPAVPCLLGEFNQVILNMTINASHAIADVVGDGVNGKGKITITTANIADQWAEIRISDTGGGIPLAARNRIFDPFFTTKEVGKGTGQGLAISHDVIVEKHKGQLSFETEMGQGTTFIIRLPLAEPTSQKNNQS